MQNAEWQGHCSMQQLSAGCFIRKDSVALPGFGEALHFYNAARRRSLTLVLCPRESGTGAVSPRVGNRESGRVPRLAAAWVSELVDTECSCKLKKCETAGPRNAPVDGGLSICSTEILLVVTGLIFAVRGQEVPI